MNKLDKKMVSKGQALNSVSENKVKTDKSGNLNHKKLDKGKGTFLVIMLAIPLLHWLVFWLYVNMSSIILAFQQPTGEWTLNNFSHVWTSLTKPGNDLWLACKNTLLYFLTNLAITIPGSLVISYFLFKRICGYKFYRVVFYLPAIVSGVVLTTVFKQLIKPWGPVGVIAEALNIDFPVAGLLGTAETATITIIVYCIWTGFCGNMLVFSGAMSRIPQSVLEAAKIEGCGPFKELWYIVLPLVWPTMTTIIIFAMTGLFNASGPILLLVNGQHETTTIAYWIFSMINGDSYGGGGGQYNLVSAAGLCFTAIAVPLILGVRHLLEKRQNVEY